MRYYTSTTQYHCGVDLHARQMCVCVMDSQGNKLLHMNIRDNDFEFFLRKIAPWRHDLTVCCACLFCRHWFADACQKAGLEFVLAHALCLKAIHGGKNKNDRIDSEPSRGPEARWAARKAGAKPRARERSVRVKSWLTCCAATSFRPRMSTRPPSGPCARFCAGGRRMSYVWRRAELLNITRRCASRDYALLRTVPGIGKVLARSIVLRAA